MDKILKIQTEIGVLVKTETNPFFKSKYMDINGLLEQLLPLLEKHGLTVIQPLKVTNSGKQAIATEIYDGDKFLLDSFLILPDIQDPQKMGSAITYYRRYALQSLFLLRAEDDDANSTVTPKSPVKAIVEPQKATTEPKLTPYETAIKYIEEAKTVSELQALNEKIVKGKTLTSDEKKELVDIIMSKLDKLDPLND